MKITVIHGQSHKGCKSCLCLSCNGCDESAARPLRLALDGAPPGGKDVFQASRLHFHRRRCGDEKH